MQIFQELRRRKVFRTALAYALVAWIIVQVAETLFPAFGVPDSILRGLVILLFVGLPVAVLFSWIYDVTPSGIVRDAEADEQASVAARPTRKLDLAIIGLLVVAIGLYVVDRFVDRPPAAIAEQGEQPVAESRAAGQAIAVLPFQNRSAREEDAYFVDGMHDDILTHLSKSRSLTVIARTSVEQFRDTRLPVKDIAERLNVTAIVEGGVQRAGDRVRINVQLIDAADESHLWAEIYDRELNAANIFATQTEVATAVADALQATFSVEEAARASTLPTNNLEAWEAYQLGRHSMRSSESGRYDAALGHFRRALELDPDFALAYVGLARASRARQYTSGGSQESALASATEAAQKALTLDPDLPEGLAMFGNLLKDRYEYDEAEDHFLRALDIDPNSAAALDSYASLLLVLGRNTEAIAPAEKLVRLDPLNVDHHQSLAVTLFAVGRFGDALARLDKALDVDPSSTFTYHEIGHILQALGRIDLALPWLEKAVELETEEWYHLLWLGNAYGALGDSAKAQHLIEEALQRSGRNHIGPLYIAGVRDLDRGDVESATQTLEEAYAIDPKFMGVVTTLAEIDMSKGDMDQARERFELALPELLSNEPVLENIDCSCSSVPLAAVLLRTGETERAERLLDLSEAWNAGKPRQGNFGYGVNDVEIHALRGDTAKALRALREAEQDGWRSMAWRYYRDFNPYLASIRSEPEFKAIFADIERDLANQQEAIAARPQDAPLDREAWKTAIDPD